MLELINDLETLFSMTIHLDDVAEFIFSEKTIKVQDVDDSSGKKITDSEKLEKNELEYQNFVGRLSPIHFSVLSSTLQSFQPEKRLVQFLKIW
jgi:hypothetical protein